MGERLALKLKLAAQAGARPVEAVFYGFGGQAEHLSCFIHCQPFKSDKKERSPERVGKRGDRRLCSVKVQSIGNDLFRVRLGGWGFNLPPVKSNRRKRQPKAHALSALMVATFVQRDGPKPGAERFRLVKPGERLPGREKALLDNIVGVIRIIRVAQSQPVQSLLIAAHNQREGSVVAGQRALNQRSVILRIAGNHSSGWVREAVMVASKRTCCSGVRTALISKTEMMVSRWRWPMATWKSSIAV